MKISVRVLFRGQLPPIVVFLCLCMVPAVSRAERVNVGLYYGRGLGGIHFNQFDLHVALALPWEKTLSDDWVLRADVEGILSLLEHEEKAFKPSLMSNLIFTSPGRKVDLFAGAGLGYMSGDTEFRDEEDSLNLGGPFFFQGQVGIRVYMTDHIFAGCRYYHQSNAGIYEYNASLNIGQIEVGWRF